MITKIAKKISVDSFSMDPNLSPDPGVVFKEHDATPKSYMGISNLRNIISNCKELLTLMNDQDELPAWLEESIAAAKMGTTKALHYVRGVKSEPTTDNIERS